MIKAIMKEIMPPIVWRRLRSMQMETKMPLSNSTGLRLAGNYPDWAAAQADSTGYDAGIILQKTRDALLKVKAGEAVYERDSVLFDEIHYSWPVLAALLWVAAQHEGRLNVLDFGGSLGSTYFQNHRFLLHLPDVRWNIVEQARQVETGKRYFEDEHLHFYTSVGTCLADTQPQVILLSSVLQYLEHPYDLLDELARISCHYLIIDRTPFWGGTSDRLFVQHVPAQIYEASYPIWVFSTQRFRSILSLHWDVTAEFDSLDRLSNPIAATWHGLISSKKDGCSHHG